MDLNIQDSSQEHGPIRSAFPGSDKLHQDVGPSCGGVMKLCVSSEMMMNLLHGTVEREY